MAYFLFFFGFFILVKGANLIVSGASFLAYKLKISPWIIGLTIVGIGTSIPEFSISFLANLFGNNEISLGTVIGSNIFNIFFVLGLAALIYPLRMKKLWVKRDMTWNVFSILIVLVFISLPFTNLEINRLEGFLLLVISAFWLYSVLKEPDSPEDEDSFPAALFTLPVAILIILAGLIGVIFGGKWVVEGAMVFADLFGISESLIALTLIGLSTSLPELAVSVTAAFRKEAGIAVGNIIGSNIVNFLMILGASAIIKPISNIPVFFYADILIAILLALFLIIFMFIGKKFVLERWQGAMFIIFYFLYIIYLLNRG